MASTTAAAPARPFVMSEPPDLRTLLHRLNNQLGVILAHAELLQSKAADEPSRLRAAQVVASALDAMGTAKEIRQQTPTPDAADDLRQSSR
jgi:hypothetical protein